MYHCFLRQHAVIVCIVNESIVYLHNIFMITRLFFLLTTFYVNEKMFGNSFV